MTGYVTDAREFLARQFAAGVVQVETGIVLLAYLDQIFASRASEGRLTSLAEIRSAVQEGVAERIRPKIMAVATTFIGLLPIFWGDEAGSAVMQRLAAPMVGGLLTDTLVTLLILPIGYEWIQRSRLSVGLEPGPLNAQLIIKNGE